MNLFKLNFNKNFNVFIKENAFKNVACKIPAISSWCQCGNPVKTGWERVYIFHDRDESSPWN